MMNVNGGVTVGAGLPSQHGTASHASYSFWLHPVSVAYNYKFKSVELNRIAKLIEARKDEIEERWNDYFDNA